MKKRSKNIAIVLIFLIGLSLLLYPFVANKWNTYRQERLISNYDAALAEKESSGGIDYDAEREKAKAYNDALMPMILPDSFAVKQAQEQADKMYLEALNLTGDEIMGIVDIPKIDIRLPIYHTTSKEVLEIAAGHLEGSSLPIGGESTHTVITAHRGLPSAALFTDLDQLKEGDHFLLHILDETLCYEVDQILVVEPDQTEALGVVSGEDLATLVTCTPYGVNTHRMLVRGHRVEYTEDVKNEEPPLGAVSFHTNYLLWVIVGLAITGVVILILYLRDRSRRKKMAMKAWSVPSANAGNAESTETKTSERSGSETVDMEEQK